jgi:Sulfotransferase domain
MVAQDPSPDPPIPPASETETLARIGGSGLRGPDFFIVGAPKCGTTALADYLGQHPEVGMCPRKETHQFVGSLAPRMAVRRGQRRRSLDEYLELFRPLQNRRRLGEASVWYLYSPDAAQEIATACPEADIIVMVRNPIDMLASLHSEFVQRELEPVGDFATALDLDETREREGTPPGFPPRSYRSAVRYAEQIERYLDVFGRERVHVIVYEDMRADALGVFRSTCAFLGVDSGFRPDLRIINPNRRTRSRLIQRLITRPPEPVRSVLHRVSSQRLRRATAIRLMKMNRRVAPREALDDRVAEALKPDVAREVAALDALLGLDVSRWLRAAAAG